VKRNQPTIRRHLTDDTDEVVSQCGKQFVATGVGSSDIEEGDKNTSETDPERTIGSERERAECISSRELPHTGTELGKSSVCEGYINTA
jgi:hypothetical protein